jgi:hypothetical protein
MFKTTAKPLSSIVIFRVCSFNYAERVWLFNALGLSIQLKVHIYFICYRRFIIKRAITFEISLRRHLLIKVYFILRKLLLLLLVDRYLTCRLRKLYFIVKLRIYDDKSARVFLVDVVGSERVFAFLGVLNCELVTLFLLNFAVAPHS